MKLTTLLGLVLGTAFVAAVLFPVFAQAKQCSKCVSSLSQVKRLGLGMVMYGADHDERLTPRDLWMDAVYPYVKDWTAFHRLAAPKGTWGLAFNGALDRAKPPRNAEQIPMIYDSVNPIKNASDLFTSLPSPGLYRGFDDVAYADGHARRVRKP